ncbi:AAA family ATPase [Butyrivibrio sp. LC3010]|uniref:AAA family ATPase n=1 Tax=Butyrivibrio sp. LC3010 TaxID=1280680 RepID=UPI0003F786D2|nr:ATP-binding protein [Butyrivibrio sp. LC3010]
MKILRVEASNFKNCEDGFSIDFMPTARKTSEDKEYELQEIAEELYVFSTVGIVGKNASGKTTVLDLLNVCYDILTRFRIGKKEYSLNGAKLTIYFFYEGCIYKYQLQLNDDDVTGIVYFEDQIIMKKEYYKTYVNKIFDDDGFEICEFDSRLPKDTSIAFFVIDAIQNGTAYIKSSDFGPDIFRLVFYMEKTLKNFNEILKKILRIFDENISGLEKVDENNYKIVFDGKEEVVSDEVLYTRLSSGTNKGLRLYMFVALSLLNGDDLIIDEIENHFHKTLVENIISLYKDKSVNKNNASLIFTTHYCELLDLFDRQDNIYVTRADSKVRLFNMYRDYNIRSELQKSKQFYNDAFNTAVNYEALMDLKKELRR